MMELNDLLNDKARRADMGCEAIGIAERRDEDVYASKRERSSWTWTR
jgi:hypothetical protein